MFGLMVSNGCISCETIAGTSVTRTSAFWPEIKVLHLFTCEGLQMLQTTPKRHFESNGVKWMHLG
jgi:hypothetical protein